MNKIIRTLSFSNEISVVLIDGTSLVKDSMRIHRLSLDAGRVFGKAIVAMTYLAGWLKDSSGELSATIKGNGTAGTITISGNSALEMRGAIANSQALGSEEKVLGKSGTLTVIRSDGNYLPFVGTVPFEKGSVEELFMDYYSQSEQLPTFLKEEILFSKEGECLSAIGVFLQPMPYASEKNIAAAKEKLSSMENFAPLVKEKGILAFGKEVFSEEEWEESEANYRCNCSRKKIEGILLSMSESECNEILRQDGKINVHCDYCETDYDFTKEDIDALFLKR